jgi:hypothetical protein
MSHIAFLIYVSFDEPEKFQCHYWINEQGLNKGVFGF